MGIIESRQFVVVCRMQFFHNTQMRPDVTRASIIIGSASCETIKLASGCSHARHLLVLCVISTAQASHLTSI